MYIEGYGLMNESQVLMDVTMDISETHRVELKVYRVDQPERYFEGVKARFALVDFVRGVPRLVVDNHVPFGFHAHTDLPNNWDYRLKLGVTDYNEALSEFWRLAWEVLGNEKKNS
jgi:hypothetical protein